MPIREKQHSQTYNGDNAMNFTKLLRRDFLKTTALTGALIELPTAYAQDTMKALVGFPAGGAIDLAARLYADSIKDIGSLIVDNRPGAAGNIAATALAQSRPDGKTIMFAPVNVYCISQILYPKLPFDASRDFAPVGIVARFPWSLAVNQNIPARTIQEFVEWLKANPDRAICGMAAIGSEGHLMAYALSKAIGVNFTFAQYKGGAPMAQDLMAGHIPFAFDPVANLAEPHKAGKVRILAVTSQDRSLLLPEVPTFQELGLRSVSGDTWIGVSVKAGTAQSQIQSLALALADASNKPDIQSKLAARGLSTVAASPALMAKAMETDSTKYAALIKDMGLKLE